MAKASFLTQADALLRKNLSYQKRNKCANITLIVFPILLCVLLATLQAVVDNVTSGMRCGCNKHNENQCGIEYSNKDQVPYCAIPDPTRWPGLLQIPAPDYRAVRTNFTNFSDLPDKSCRKNESCPVVTLLTGNNPLLAQSVGKNMLEAFPWNSPTLLGGMANNVLGSASVSGDSLDLDTGYFPGSPLYKIQSQCTPNSTWSTEINVLGKTLELEIKCAQSLNLWRNSSSEISDELYKGYWRGNPNNDTNEIVTAYDLLNSNNAHLNVNVWYNATYKNDTGYNWLDLIGLTKVPRSVNLVSNAYLQFLSGTGTRMQFEFIKDTPKPETKNRVDVSSLLGTQFFAYVIIALFPTMLTFLVYENQNRLQIMMKMHGLGDGPYRLISYVYFLALSSLYMVCFVTFGSIIGLKIFRLNDYGVQFIFYFLYINLQISLAFLAASLFTNVITARVVGYIFIFGSGLLGSIIFQSFVEDPSFPRVWIVVMELYPGFALYRGLYELGQYSFNAYSMGTLGMGWKNLSDSENGMREVLILMFLEWLIVLPLAIYLDQVVSSGSGVRKRPLHFLSPRRKSNSKAKRNASEVSVPTEKPDVALERAKVERLLDEGGSLSHSIICDDLSKVYPGRDGNLPKCAVKGVSLALSRGECFGMLGPNGAGKTSFISMMVGLSEPTSGRAYVEGHDISTQMDEVYTSMGVCPQHDLLWETLTGREHLLFYGRLKNLKGDRLLQEVEESLMSVNLFHGGVGDKFVKKYSGGMKRRLSVAISLIGDPKVVYMNEPGTGLDPASRNNLWNVVKRAKRDRAIILTTHSMEEAEYLCDRLGIFVDGSLQCVGNPKELKARYGGSFVLTMTTSSSHEGHVESMVGAISPNAQRIYRISGTQKFELPKQEVRISDVFLAVQNAKSRFPVYAWGLTDTTLEDVFVKVAREA